METLKKKCEICSELTIRKPDINDLILVFLFLTQNIFHTFFSVFIVDFEQVNVSWIKSPHRACFSKVLSRLLEHLF